MKKILVAVALASLVASASPALADSPNHYVYLTYPQVAKLFMINVLNSACFGIPCASEQNQQAIKSSSIPGSILTLTVR